VPWRALPTALSFSLIISLGLVIAIFLLSDPIPQDRTYHDFVDQRHVLGLPHGLNVLSNGAFLLVAVVGFVTRVGTHRSPLTVPSLAP